MSASYPNSSLRRTALVPGVIAAIICIAGVALVGGDSFTIVRFAVAIFALIVAWFAFQARNWVWVVAMVAVAVLWNPVFPFDIGHFAWSVAQYVAALLFILAGVFIKVRDES
jgi:hypothetical protein